MPVSPHLDRRLHVLVANNPDADEMVALLGASNPAIVGSLRVYPGATTVVGVSYASIKDAVDYVTALGTCSLTSPWAIWVAAGVYDEDPFTVISGLAILGDGYYTTQIRTTSNAAHFITMRAGSWVTGVAITGPTGAPSVGFAAFNCIDHTSPAPVVLNQVVIRKGYYGVWLHPVGGVGTLHMTQCGNWYSGAAMHEFVRVSDDGAAQVHNTAYMCGPGGGTAHGFTCEGPNSELVLDVVTFRDVLATCGVYANDGATVTMQACKIEESVIGVHIGPIGATIVRASGCVVSLPPDVTTLFKVESATAEMVYIGTGDATTIDVVAGAILSGVVANRMNSATYNLGEFYLGNNVAAQYTPMKRWTDDNAASGWTGGGVLSAAAGTPATATITAGTGWINNGTWTRPIAWGGQTIPLLVGFNNVYIDAAGVANTSASDPDYATVIHIGDVWVNDAAVKTPLAVFPEHVTVDNIPAGLHEYTQDVLGSLTVSGFVTTIAGGPSRKLTVDQGVCYVANIRQAVDAGNPAGVTFTIWYQLGAAWNTETYPAETLVDNSQWNSAGALAALGASWKKDLLCIVPGPANAPSYHIVLAQQTYGNQADAEGGALPALPDFLRLSALRVAGIVLTGGGNIASITDERPFLGQLSPGTTAAAVHGLLAGLAADDHTQYALLSGNAARNHVTGTLDASAGGVTLPVSAAPAQIITGAVVWDSVASRLTVGTGAARKLLANVGDAAGGDLSGAYPNPTVTGLSLAGAVQGSIAYYDGANWVVLGAPVAGTWTLQIVGGGGTNPAWSKAPTVADFTNAQHDHSGASQGGAVPVASVTGAAHAATTLTAGAGLTGGGDLSAGRTFDVGANADGSITVNANDLQVGVLATDAQHGNRGGGGIHANAAAGGGGVAGFMSGADKIKLDTIAANATVASVGATAPITTTGGANPTIGINAASGAAPGSMSAADFTKLAGIGAGATVVSVGGTAPIASTGGANPAISIGAASGASPGSMSAADFTKLAGITAGAAVASVSGTAPIVSGGGTTPAISITAATTLAAGSMSAADKTKLDAMSTDTAGHIASYANPAASTSAPTTASATFAAAIPQMTVTFTPKSATNLIRVQFDGSFTHSTNNATFAVEVFVDGVGVVGTRRDEQFGATAPRNITMDLEYWTTLSAAAHTIEIRWLTSAATLTGTLLQRGLRVIEYTYP